jgi:formate C-acetyltransferase
MSMTERVKKLRQHSLDAEEVLSSERAELLTEFYQRDGGRYTRSRANALNISWSTSGVHQCDELIVGEKGPGLKNAHIPRVAATA